MDTHYYYVLLMAASLLGPILQSFESRVSYYRSFIPLFLSIAIVSSIFLVWDIIFTHLGYWGFNEQYLTGISLFGLPLGEYLFFVIIPFCCVFIYRVMNYYYPHSPWGSGFTNNLSNFLIGLCGALAIIYYDRWYSVLTFGTLAVLIHLHAKVWHSPWLAHFYRAYLVILIPFFIVNGILTGTGIDQEIVWYNEQEMIGKRILSIPMEDAFYGMILILGIVSLYERFGKQWGYSYAYEITTE